MVHWKLELQRFIRRTLRRYGVDVQRVRRAVHRAGYAYEEVRPHATYAPWRTDAGFRTAWEEVQAHTLVDEYRLYELWWLVGQTAAVPGEVLEVGVWRGGSGALMARRARLTGSPSTVYLCDTFSGVAKASPYDSRYQGGEHADTSRATVEKLCGRMRLDNVHILEGLFPDETAPAITGKTFRLVHLDVDVYESARSSLHWVWPRLALGGVVVFDDYGRVKCDGVTRLVEEEAHVAGRLVVPNLNGHAVMVKTSAPC